MIFFKACKDCKPPKRKPGCHGDCSDYKKERAEYDAFKKAERKFKEKENLMYIKHR